MPGLDPYPVIITEAVAWMPGSRPGMMRSHPDFNCFRAPAQVQREEIGTPAMTEADITNPSKPVLGVAGR
jgi:hypothetical protein